MAFRTLEITKESEIHMRNGQMHIIQEEGEIVIPLEDLSVVTCLGANIRISTMGMIQLANHGVVLQCIDEHYIPQALVIPCESNARQSKIMHHQITMPEERVNELWKQIVQAKIKNQAGALTILGLKGAAEIGKYSLEVKSGDADNREAVAAKEYFEMFHPGLNRRNDDPINSGLNYGYAVLRSAIIRSAMASGFLIGWGIHHHNQLNAYNLADDLIEPFRPMVDIVAHEIVTSSKWLTKEQRYQLANVLHNMCMMNGKKMTVLAAIDMVTDGLRRYVLNEKVKKVQLPLILPIETVGLITE